MNLLNLGGIFDLESKLSKIKELEKIMSRPDFWNVQDEANKVIAQLKDLKRQAEPVQKVESDMKSISELIEWAEPEDGEILKQINTELSGLEKAMDKLEISLLFSGSEDSCNAFLSIHAGAGGTESCDWASMLLRMYKRWAESNEFSVEEIDFLAGDEAGVKGVTILIKGVFVYGRLKGENGVHRLVRISPFDSNKRRHTSFVSVEVIPEIDKDINIEIKDEEIRVDVYRSSGAGGQHVNTTDSAVRITHLSTGIVVQCQNERSQIKNRATAMKMLQSKLYELELKQRQEKSDKHNQQKKKIEWGSQIRSYVMHPYNMVKDHRTAVETGNVQAIMDGKIDAFLEGFLKWQANQG
ncbi:MAG: peptide chain release factor 2 [Candidatus Omnitrophica bacterium]|nr:peptide chain release factor 2 [Candidatus Omnitrophota bacterium]